MRWWDKPLTARGRGLALIVFGAVMVAGDLTLPRGWEYVFEQAKWLPVRYLGWAVILYGGVLIAGYSLFPSGRDRQVPAREAAVSPRGSGPARRPAGAAPRIACRKCGELVEVEQLEDRECDRCRAVGEGGYR